MPASEDKNNLPAPASGPQESGLDRVKVSDEEARRALATLTTGDPAVRKRIFSALLRAMSAGGS